MHREALKKLQNEGQKVSYCSLFSVDLMEKPMDTKLVTLHVFGGV